MTELEVAQSLANKVYERQNEFNEAMLQATLYGLNVSIDTNEMTTLHGPAPRIFADVLMHLDGA